MNGEREGD